MPDIPVFLGMILRNIYERLLCCMDTPQGRKIFLSCVIGEQYPMGDTQCAFDEEVKMNLSRNGILPEEYQDQEQIEQTAGS